jgi:broad specificity phosphatase PhoE
MTARLHLVRHGETDGNVAGRAQGRRDVPLNDFGRQQAAALAMRFRAVPAVRVLCSDASRARDTAEPIARALGLAVEIDPRLAEVDQGELDGLTGEEMRERAPEFLERWGAEDPSDLRIPGGETLGETQERMVAAVNAAASEAVTKSIVIVSHNLAIKTLLCHAIGAPLRGFRALQVDTASVSLVDWRAGTPWTVIEINDRCHLEGAGVARADR